MKAVNSEAVAQRPAGNINHSTDDSSHGAGLSSSTMALPEVDLKEAERFVNLLAGPNIPLSFQV